MPNVYRTLTRLQDLDDLSPPAGAGDTGKAYVWDNSQSKFVLTAYLPLTGGTISGNLGIGGSPGTNRLFVGGAEEVENIALVSAGGRGFGIKIDDNAPTQITFGSITNNSFSIVRNNINRLDFFSTSMVILDGSGQNIAVWDVSNQRLDVLNTPNSGPGSSSARISGTTADSWLNSNGGNLGLGTRSPAISAGAGLHMAGSTMRLGTSRTPASAGATGNVGEICWDANHIYVCIATNTWRRIAHATW